MKDAFSGCHPAVNFTYFAFVLLFGMLFLHPVFLAVSLCSAFAYSTYLNRGRAVKFNLWLTLPAVILFSLFNPLVNHRGITVLFYLAGNPVTRESVLYGAASAVMLSSVIIWFSCYHVVMTSDKFIHLFGRAIPALSLIFTMVLRFVPRFKNQLQVIAGAQRAIGRDMAAGSLRQRIRHGALIFSILITWALENAVETADSMRSRGYGMAGRTQFSHFRFDRRDALVLGILLALAGVVLAGAALGENTVRFFPALRVKAVSPLSIAVYAAYILLLNLPVVLDIQEDIRWKRLQSTI